jgi:hypothetical protein
MSVFYAPGKYACQITNQALGETTSTKKPQFVLQFKVLGLVDPANPANYIPATAQYDRTSYRVITDKTIDYFIEDLRAMGFQGTSFKHLDPKSEGFHDFVGLDLDMVCTHDTYEGKTNEKWNIARSSDFSVEALEPAKVRELDNLFGANLKAMKKTNGAKPQPPQPAIATMDHGLTDDEPF